MKRIAVLAPTREDFDNWVEDNGKERINYIHVHNFRFGQELFDGMEEGYNADKMNWGIKNVLLRQIRE
jgi:hypothetical protein